MSKILDLYKQKQIMNRATRLTAGTETKEAKAINEAHKQMQEYKTITELDKELEALKKEKVQFEKEKAEFYKKMPQEIETKAKQQVGQVIEDSLKNVFK